MSNVIQNESFKLEKNIDVIMLNGYYTYYYLKMPPLFSKKIKLAYNLKTMNQSLLIDTN